MRADKRQPSGWSVLTSWRSEACVRCNAFSVATPSVLGLRPSRLFFARGRRLGSLVGRLGGSCLRHGLLPRLRRCLVVVPFWRRVGLPCVLPAWLLSGQDRP